MRRWLSLHVRYHDIAAQDNLLLRCVKPLFVDLTSVGLSAQHFFIRYSAGGPHLRLRVLPIAHKEDACRRIMVHRVADFLRSCPSQARPTLPAPYAEDNSWTYVPYEPEVARYGGRYGLTLAERHFQDSTDLALTILQRAVSFDDTAGAKLAYALQITAILPLAAGFPKSTVWRFFHDIAARALMDAEPTDDEYPSLLTHLTNPLQASFRRLPDCQSISDHFHDQPIAIWTASTKKISENLKAYLSSVPQELWRQLYGETTPDGKYLQIIQDYAHMFINRLGFTVQQEARIYQLSRDTWRSLAGTS